MSDTELRQELEQLRAEIRRVDEWSNGLYLALLEVLPLLLTQQPEAVERLEPMWHSAADRHAARQENPAQHVDEEGPIGLLEPRKMLYRQMDALGVWGSR